MKLVKVTLLLTLVSTPIFSIEKPATSIPERRPNAPLVICFTSILTHGLQAFSQTYSPEQRISAVTSALHSIALLTQLASRDISFIPKPAERSVLNKLPEVLTRALKDDVLFLNAIKSPSNETAITLKRAIEEACPQDQQKELSHETVQEDHDPIPGIMFSNFMNILICGFHAINHGNNPEDRIESAANALQSIANILGLAFRITKTDLTTDEKIALKLIQTNLKKVILANRDFMTMTQKTGFNPKKGK